MLDYRIMKRIGEGSYFNNEDSFIIERAKKEKLLRLHRINSEDLKSKTQNRDFRKK